MTRSRQRALLAVTAIAAVLLYLGVALLVAEVIALVAPGPIDPVLFVGMIVLTALAFGYGSYRAGTTHLLSSLDARPVAPGAAPNLHRRLDRLCERMAVDRPQLFVTEMDAPNALAMGGRGSGVIVLDHRLTRLLRPAELDAILAHELAHLEGYDGLVQTLAQSLVQTIAGLVFLVLLPIALLIGLLQRLLLGLLGGRPKPLAVQITRTHYVVAQFVVLVLLVFTLALRAHSRHRELDADDRAVAVTGDPLALARGLRRIQLASDPYRGRWSSLFIHGEEQGELTRLLATHPEMDERIERLRRMAGADDRIPIRVS